MNAGMFSPDIQAFLRLLDRYEVRYVLVGGFAVIYHGHDRLTGDIDFLYGQDQANVQRLYDALVEFWEGPVPGLANAGELAEPHIVVQFGRPPNRIDLIGGIKGLDFAELWSRRVSAPLEGAGWTASLQIIGLRDLIQAKQIAGRSKDLDDLEHLLPLTR